VGIVDRQFHVLISKMRPGVASITTDDSDSNFIQLMPPIIIDAVEKMSPMLGVVESVTVRYEKLFFVFFAKGNYVIVLSFNPDIQRPFMSALTGWDQSLASKLLAD